MRNPVDAGEMGTDAIEFSQWPKMTWNPNRTLSHYRLHGDQQQIAICGVAILIDLRLEMGNFSN